MKRILIFLIGTLAAFACQKEQETKDLIIIENSHLSFPREGGTIALRFSSTTAWTAGLTESDASSWCTLDISSGDPGDATILITLTANDTPETRKADIYIRDSDRQETEYVTIEQEVTEGLISIQESSLKFPAEGAVTTLRFTSTLDWSIQKENPDCDWCTISRSSGTAGEIEIEVFVSPNTDPEPRLTKLIIQNENRTAVEHITIEQYNESDMLDVNFFEIATSPNGESIILNVKAECEWNVSSSGEWCTAENITDGKQLKITTDTNDSGAKRSATVTVSTPLASRQHSITVSQNPASDNENPGWVGQNFDHNSLGLTFTATWCGYCPSMSEAMKLSKSIKGNMELMNIHMGGSELEYKDYPIFSTQYMCSATPVGIIDGRIKIENTNGVEALAKTITAAASDTEAKFTTQSSIRFKPELQGNLLSIDVVLKIKDSGTYKLALYLLQDGINAAQANYYIGSNHTIIHDNILIDSISDHLGDTFTVNSNSETSFSYMTNIPEDVPTNDLRILAVVFSEFPNGDISSSEDYGNYFVDNCLSGSIDMISSTETGGNEVLMPGDIIK